MSDVNKEHLTRRAEAICRALSKYLRSDETACFYMAGGCLTGRISDIDLFPGSTPVPAPVPDLPVIFETRNATTYQAQDWPIQVCRYQHNSLKELVDSFDFAHIQVGVSIEHTGGEGGNLVVQDVYFTDAFVDSRALGISWFTGSQYPLSSLMRAGKYYKRGDIPKGSYTRAMLDIVADIFERGFRSYDDFKDQLDAVDLGLVPEESEDISHAELLKLFEQLDRGAPAESEAADE